MRQLTPPRTCFIFLLALLLGLGLGSWQELLPLQAEMAATPIQSLLANPPQQPGRVLQLSGTVQRQVPLWQRVVYALDDGTGQVWVVATAEVAPAPGDRVTIRGRVQYANQRLPGLSQDGLHLAQVELVQRQPATEATASPAPAPSP